MTFQNKNPIPRKTLAKSPLSSKKEIWPETSLWRDCHHIFRAHLVSNALLSRYLQNHFPGGVLKKGALKILQYSQGET